MKVSEVLALTGASKPSLYRWMEKHPVLNEQDPHSPRGHPFPKPIKKEGREVIWDGDEVGAWWVANCETVGRQTETTTIPWSNYLAAMRATPEPHADGFTDDMELILKMERVGPDVRLWFRNPSDAVFFKLKHG